MFIECEFPRYIFKECEKLAKKCMCKVRRNVATRKLSRREGSEYVHHTAYYHMQLGLLLCDIIMSDECDKEFQKYTDVNSSTDINSVDVSTIKISESTLLLDYSFQENRDVFIPVYVCVFFEFFRETYRDYVTTRLFEIWKRKGMGTKRAKD